jgi:putative phage-type endonuclease
MIIDEINLILDDIILNSNINDFNSIKEYIISIINNIYKRSQYHTNIIDQAIIIRLRKFNNNRYIFKLKNQVEILNGLLLLPKQFSQKSKNWLEFRHNHINASEANNILTGSRNSILNHKIKPLILNSNSGVACNHGNIFENISNLIYCDKYNRIVYMFESIEHKDYNFIAASPDGINDLGILVEYKNPISREIIGAPKDEYWVQTQIQMETCNLERCHFVECNYNFYETLSDLFTKSHEYCGIIITYYNGDNTEYIYSNIKNNTYLDLNNWLHNIVDTVEYDLTIKYWGLKEFSLYEIYRDHKWFKDTLPLFIEFWNDVIKYRQNPDSFEYKSRQKSVTKKQILINSD